LGVYVVATCNDIEKLPPEFIRAERWDAIWFFDLPASDERDEIARLYAAEYDVPLDPRPDESGWTGAEIKTAYRLAAVLNVTAKEAAQYVVPLANTMREKIQELRDWAAGRCVQASEPMARGAGTAETVKVLS
jgi:SpoVK/Ycf46/Vps4 family AAA+-type ATPase